MKNGERSDLLARYRVTDGSGFKLKKHDPADTAGIDQEKAETWLADGVARLAELQERLYASSTWAMLVVLQAMDAAGKDGTIKHVMTGVNPQGVQVTSFKGPSTEERAHDFLWRHSHNLPRRGVIGLHNRSHYEEVLAVRVHPALLDGVHLPSPARDQSHFWRNRLADIANWEAYLSRQGLVQLKLFLHVSQEEQRKRLLARLDDRKKTWKFDQNDLTERVHWTDYMATFEAAIAATAAPHAPWYVIPADNKWFTHLIAVDAMVAALELLDLKIPRPSGEMVAQIAEFRAQLSEK